MPAPGPAAAHHGGERRALHEVAFPKRRQRPACRVAARIRERCRGFSVRDRDARLPRFADRVVQDRRARAAADRRHSGAGGDGRERCGSAHDGPEGEPDRRWQRPLEHLSRLRDRHSLRRMAFRRQHRATGMAQASAHGPRRRQHSRSRGIRGRRRSLLVLSAWAYRRVDRDRRSARWRRGDRRA